MDISAFASLDDLPSLPLTEKKRFPHVTAVYLVLDAMQRPIYIGSTMNLRYRWRKHAYRAYLLAQPEIRVAWLACATEERFAIEHMLIAHYKPVLNGTAPPSPSRPSTLVERVCSHCKARFHTYPKKPNIFCGLACRDASKGVTWVEIICRMCAQPFSIERSRAKKGEARFCSSACLAASRQQFSPIFIAKFWARVARCTHEEGCPFCCWPWQGKCGNGYGRVLLQGKEHPAHRISWEITHHQTLPAFVFTHVIRHLCNNPICVNPLHLAYGTQALNAQDKVSAGHQQRGEQCAQSKLTVQTVQQVRSMRQQGFPYYVIAARFGVTTMAIANCCRRKTWKHVP